MKFILFLSLLFSTLCGNLRFMETTTPTAQGQQIKGLSAASSYVSSITSTYQSLVQAVKTSKSDVYKAMWKNAGFAEIDLRGTIKVTQGIQEIYYYKYRDNIARTFRIPDSLKPYFDDYIQDDDESDHASWGKTILDYAQDRTDGENLLTHLTFMANHRDDGKVDATAMSISFKFDLATQVEVITHSLSVAGGIYAHQKDEVIEKPRSMTEEDLEAMINIAELLSFRFVGYQLGIVLTLPEF